MNFQKGKFFLILFKSSKVVLNYYNSLFSYMDDFFYLPMGLYRNIFSFLRMQKVLIKHLKSLVNIFLNNFKKTKFNLKFKIKKKIELIKPIQLFLQIFFLNLNFSKMLVNIIPSINYFDSFFENLIYRMFKKINIKNVDLVSFYNRSEIYKEVYERKLAHRYFWFHTNKGVFFYLYFLLDWNYNFHLIRRDVCIKEDFYRFMNVFHRIDEDYMILLKKYRDMSKRYINIKEIYFFFFEFLDLILYNVKKLLYCVISTHKNIKHKYFIYVLYSYVLKLRNKHKNEIEFESKSDFINKFFLDSLISISSVFLDKFFYYRHLYKFFDKKITIDYNVLKPFNFLNLSFLESNFYNLSLANKLYINKKLDKFFKNLSDFSIQNYPTEQKSFKKQIKKYKNVFEKSNKFFKKNHTFSELDQLKMYEKFYNYKFKDQSKLKEYKKYIFKLNEMNDELDILEKKREFKKERALLDDIWFVKNKLKKIKTFLCFEEFYNKYKNKKNVDKNISNIRENIGYIKKSNKSCKDYYNYNKLVFKSRKFHIYKQFNFFPNNVLEGNINEHKKNQNRYSINLLKKKIFRIKIKRSKIKKKKRISGFKIRKLRSLRKYIKSSSFSAEDYYKSIGLENDKNSFINMFLLFYRNKYQIYKDKDKNIYYNFWFNHR